MEMYGWGRVRGMSRSHVLVYYERCVKAHEVVLPVQGDGGYGQSQGLDQSTSLDTWK